MEMMKAPQAPVLDHMEFGRVKSGFMRLSDGRILYLEAHGRWTLAHDVLTDGTIVPKVSELDFYPNTIVEIVHPKDLGITEIRWAPG